MRALHQGFPAIQPDTCDTNGLVQRQLVRLHYRRGLQVSGAGPLFNNIFSEISGMYHFFGQTAGKFREMKWKLQTDKFNFSEGSMILTFC